MMEQNTRPRPKGREAYRHFTAFATRWRDNDQYGHMNNAVYYELFDQFLVASSGCDYFTDVAYPSDVDVGLAVRRIGKSSVTYDVGLFLADADITAATGVFVHVNVATDDQRPLAIDAATRAKCAALMIDGE